MKHRFIGLTHVVLGTHTIFVEAYVFRRLAYGITRESALASALLAHLRWSNAPAWGRA